MKKITDRLEIVKGRPARNRIVLPPMDTIMTDGDGFVKPFHVQHYGARAYGGCGTIIVETTAVSSEGKILKRDLGLWDDEQVWGHKQIVDLSKEAGAVIGVQLNHAGAKAEMEDEQRIGSSNLYNYLPTPLTLITQKDIERIEEQFVEAAHRAKKAGYDFVELHGAHGYLISELINPQTNEVIKSDDITVRGEIAINIVRRIHDEVKIPVGIRFSTSDNEPGGLEPVDFKPLVKVLDRWIAYYNISSGEVISKENVVRAIKESGNPLYRLRLVREFKKFTNAPLIMAGNVITRKQVEEAIEAGVDGVALGREQLFNPYAVVNSLLTASELNPDDYHWNGNSWFNPAAYSALKESLKGKK